MAKRLFFWILLFTLIGCSSDESRSYLVDANVLNDERPLFAVHRHTDQTIVIDTLYPNGDFFRIKGEDPSLAVVDLLDEERTRILTLFLQNGIRLAIKGDLSKPDELRVTGNSLNEEINKTLREYAPILNRLRALRLERAEIPEQQTNRLARLDYERDSLHGELLTEITRQVTNNPAALSSAALIHQLVAHRLPNDSVSALVQLLDSTVLIESGVVGEELLALYERAKKEALFTEMPTYFLSGTDARKIGLHQQKGKVQVWHLWDVSHLDLRMAERIDALYEQMGDSTLQVTTLFLDTDTTQWKKTIEKRFSHVTNLQEPKGYSAPVLRSLGISELPFTLIFTKENLLFARGVTPDNLIRTIGEAQQYQPKDPSLALVSKQEPTQADSISAFVATLFLPEGYTMLPDKRILHQSETEKIVAEMTTPLQYIFLPDSLLKQPFYIQYPPLRQTPKEEATQPEE